MKAMLTRANIIANIIHLIKAYNIKRTQMNGKLKNEDKFIIIELEILTDRIHSSIRLQI